MFKALDLWLPAYLRRPAHIHPSGTTHILLAVCDHFEPLHHADRTTAMNRIARWQREFPALTKRFSDADGQTPRHTFFYPIEQYNADIVSALADLCRACRGEVEIHLHHDSDTADALRAKLERGKEDLARHQLLSTDATNQLRFGFIHGNWALANSHPEEKNCGVTNELTVLREAGCFADFTMPSAPHPTQTRIINSIYYAADNGRPKPHDAGQLAAVHSKPETQSHKLLLVQGPLGLNWERRKFGVLPRIENADLTGANPPTPERLRVWLRTGVHVGGRPDWIFIKLHTHGGIEQNMKTLLGDPMSRFLDHLLANYNDGRQFATHFLSAREMVNIIHAAEDGCSGNPGAFRNHHLRSRFHP